LAGCGGLVNKRAAAVRAAAQEYFKPRRNSALVTLLYKSLHRRLTATYFMLTLIAFGLASSFFGKLKRNMPSLYSALIASALIFGGSVNER
jgi:hypothetical protein